MFAPAAQPKFDASDPDEDRSAAHRLMLQELGEMAMDLAGALHGGAIAEAEAAAAVPEDQPAARAAAAERAGRLAGAFARVARAVRQTVALEGRMQRLARRAEEADDGEAQAGGEMSEAQRQAMLASEARMRVVLRRAAVLNSLEPLILERPDSPERERLLDDLYERLDVAAAEPGFVRERMSPLVERIRSELDLAVPPGYPLKPPDGAPWMHRGAIYGRGGGP